MTFLTNTNVEGHAFPFAFDCITGANTGVDFADFVQMCLEHGSLVAGDFLIMDNAAYALLLSCLISSACI
jgi:hypothetical protein